MTARHLRLDQAADKPSGTRAISAVDLFCGLGGLTHGLSRAGVRVVAGIDLDEQCRFAYEANNAARFIAADVRTISSESVAQLLADADIRLLAGCAPCQPFSTYSRKNRLDESDEKWDLLKDFGRLVREVQPDLVTMENVPQLLEHSVFDDFLEALRGYHTWWGVVNCVDFGIPQARRRLVFLGSKLGPVKLADPVSSSRRVTVRDAIGHLPSLQAGGVDATDALHAACSLSELNLARIRASRPGGTWRDWDEALRARCHQKGSGQTYPSVYGRMEWDGPSPTITTQCFGYGNGRFGHPEQDRALSLREAAILQTFPANYVFLAPGEKLRFSKLGRLIGNAVPVRLGEVVGRSLELHLAASL